ncbi:hypothetical protein FVE85_5526 [Porphyridium purpureum]|uniref:Uncharacterized protein n=1 Tax=Porphyridium purpureum TaxID=35688 RepID=A0A5J4Z276_PORPP|nr:hypothetical protein FVE85_5526 [Porphyridium purpureum]|eukprot:POR5967..scf295_1
MEQTSQPSTSGNPVLGVLEPGIAARTHAGLRAVLVLLNVVLFGLSAAGFNWPHSPLMFLLSMGLTASYFWFMYELAKGTNSSQTEHQADPQVSQETKPSTTSDIGSMLTIYPQSSAEDKDKHL